MPCIYSSDLKEVLRAFISVKKKEAGGYLHDARELSGDNSIYSAYQRGYLAALTAVEKKMNNPDE